ncbi:MAG: hypothetical protein JWR38_1306 [Mucilaginibacter sp.]|jgi:hypothetical protein|nr:hypothetical protein [Mucilaginibacter sp.]
MDEGYIKILLQRFVENNIEKEDYNERMSYVKSHVREKEMLDFMMEEWNKLQNVSTPDDSKMNSLYNKTIKDHRF